MSYEIKRIDEDYFDPEDLITHAPVYGVKCGVGATRR